MMGSLLGHDFSKVRLHSEEAAADSASQLGWAYTVGGHAGGVNRDPHRATSTDGSPILTGAPDLAAGVPPEVHRVLASPGGVLPPPVRADMEHRFRTVAGAGRSGMPTPEASTVSSPFDTGERQADEVARQVTGPSGRPPAGHPAANHDFADVRVHADGEAGDAAQAVGASAFTVGSHVVFAPGAYAPTTAMGRTLLAHELAHVLQQRTMPGSGRRPVARQVADAGPAEDPVRRLQVACVIRLGGCPSSRDAGVPSSEEFRGYNAECRQQYAYKGPDVYPTDEECRNPPEEPLSFGEKVLLGAFLVVGTAAAIALVVVAAEAVVVPVAIAAVEAAGAAGTSALAVYYANAIAVNEIGLFAAGLVIGCEGDVVGLVRSLADNPAQAATILAEVYVLHVNIRVAGGSSRPATVPVKLLPPEEQTSPGVVRFRSVGAPTFETPEATPAPQPVFGPPAPSRTPETELAEFQEMVRQEGGGPVRPTGEPVELLPYARARQTRQALGLGPDVEAAHGLPRAVGRGVPGYDPKAAVTTLQQRVLHTELDRPMKDAFQTMRRQGATTATGQQIFDTVADSIRRSPLSPQVSESLIARLSDEMWVEFGMSPGTQYPLPYPNIGPVQ
jgi:hypothetical protein